MAVRAPAAWIGDWVQSQGKLRLIDARGTVWSGSAMLGLSDGRQVMLVPGRVSWEVGLAAIFSGRVTADVAHPALRAPLAVSYTAKSTAVKAGQAELPAAVLAALGAPFNTVRPGGVLSLRWTDVEIKNGVLAGDLQIEWREAQSALSTVAPLGSYRLRITGAGDAARLQLETLSGPLHLDGGGTLKGGRVSFKGLAFADPDMRTALQGLIGVLGPR
ncbi:MAG: type II secretion system protein N, partial [Betaproteobacteria bacterium]|nr:type II secretion system protein N [Betaproteobacteria bacterium]